MNPRIPFQKHCLCGKGYMSRVDHMCANCRGKRERQLAEEYARKKVLRIIVAGGRDYTDKEGMHNVMQNLVRTGVITQPCELVCGMARGADITAHNLFTEYDIRIHEFPADWDGVGRSAGFVRNREMAYFADILIAFWDGKSAGTQHMIAYMEKLNKPVYVCKYVA